MDYLTKELTSLKVTITVIGKPNSELHSSSQLKDNRVSNSKLLNILSNRTLKHLPLLKLLLIPTRGSIAEKNTDKRYEEDRNFNVVIHGIEECCKGIPKYERLKHDLKEVTSLITNTESSISPLSIRDHLRL